MSETTDLFADTNVLIRLLEGDELVATLLAGKTIYISEITEMEMQCKPNQPAEDRKLIRLLLDDCIIIELNSQVKAEAIRIRRMTRMKLMDAIVAASAVVTGLPLLTADNGFERLKTLNLLLLPAR